MNDEESAAREQALMRTEQAAYEEVQAWSNAKKQAVNAAMRIRPTHTNDANTRASGAVAVRTPHIRRLGPSS